MFLAIFGFEAFGQCCFGLVVITCMCVSMCDHCFGLVGLVCVCVCVHYFLFPVTAIRWPGGIFDGWGTAQGHSQQQKGFVSSSVVQFVHYRLLASPKPKEVQNKMLCSHWLLDSSPLQRGIKFQAPHLDDQFITETVWRVRSVSRCMFHQSWREHLFAIGSVKIYHSKQ